MRCRSAQSETSSAGSGAMPACQAAMISAAPSKPAAASSVSLDSDTGAVPLRQMGPQALVQQQLQAVRADGKLGRQLGGDPGRPSQDSVALLPGQPVHQQQ